jgi:hypothetical protein
VPALSLDDLRDRLSRHAPLLDGDEPLSRDQAAEIIRLWNTASYYPALAREPAIADFLERVLQRFDERIGPALDMEVTSGFALRSDELDLTFGGNLPAGSRFRVSDLEAP